MEPRSDFILNRDRCTVFLVADKCTRPVETKMTPVTGRRRAERAGSVKHYIQGVLGGILAILAAFGWTVTVTAVIAWKFGGVGVARSGGGAFWLILF
jgi:hypothetical protein